MAGYRDKFQQGDVFARQIDLFDPLKYREEVHIIGVGATGSFDAMCLAKLGFSEIHIWDYDIVEVKNQAGQLYGLSDVEKPKVEACKDIVGRVGDIDLITHNEKWDGQELRGVVIAGLDSMDGRKAIFSACRMKMRIKLLLDHRIGGETIQILVVKPMSSDSCALYEETLFEDKDAAPLPCTQRSVIYQNFIVAGLSVNIIRNFLVGNPVPNEIIYSGKSMEFSGIK